MTKIFFTDSDTPTYTKLIREYEDPKQIISYLDCLFDQYLVDNTSKDSMIISDNLQEKSYMIPKFVIDIYGNKIEFEFTLYKQI